MALTLSVPTANKVNWLRDRPIAHRGLHDPKTGRYENTLEAAKSAASSGYSIEVDLQLSADGIPVVFHDYSLDRMTGMKADIRTLRFDELETQHIMGTRSRIPSLKQLLELIQGAVGIVLELKGKPGHDNGFVEAVYEELRLYNGNVAIMSFHHHLVEETRLIAPHISLGLTAEGDDTTYETHKMIAEKADVDFISYELANLDTRFVREFRQTGRPVISWTVRNEKDASYSSRFADQPTFEGFLA